MGNNLVRTPTAEEGVQYGRAIRDTQMAGTLAGAQYRLLDDIMDQIVSEVSRHELSGAECRQLLRDTKAVINGHDSRYIYLALRLPASVIDAMGDEGYAVWWIATQQPAAYAVYLPRDQDETRGQHLQQLGYSKF